MIKYNSRCAKSDTPICAKPISTSIPAPWGVNTTTRVESPLRIFFAAAPGGKGLITLPADSATKAECLSIPRTTIEYWLHIFVNGNVKDIVSKYPNNVTLLTNSYENTANLIPPEVKNLADHVDLFRQWLKKQKAGWDALNAGLEMKLRAERKL